MHSAQVGHNNVSVATYREQTVEIAVESKGVFKNDPAPGGPEAAQGAKTPVGCRTSKKGNRVAGGCRDDGGEGGSVRNPFSSILHL
jgi:hypothetical protein